MQLANELEARAIRLCNQATSRLIMAFAGTAAAGFVKFVVDSFGSASEFSEAEAAATLDLPTGDTEEESDDDGDEGLVSKSAGAPVDAEEPKDLCDVKEAKPVFPIDHNSLSMTGVPSDYVSENIPMGASCQSHYFCLFGSCHSSSLQKATLATHIRRKHLGVAVACKFCGKLWWSSRPFEGHMKKLHTEILEPDWWTPFDATAKAAEEAQAAQKLLESKLEEASKPVDQESSQPAPSQPASDEMEVDTTTTGASAR